MKIEIQDVTKSYGDVKALDHVNLCLENGIYALLGPNGAGKSTLMNILVTLLKADQGKVLFEGKEISEERQSYVNILGYMPQKQCLYEDFTLKDFLYYIGSLKAMQKQEIIERSAYLVKEVKLEEQFHRKIRTFSGGMKQRAMLAAALLNDPKVLILDEPTAGLDPMKRSEMGNLIAGFANDKIILFATHVVGDVEFIANQFIFLKKGNIMLQSDRLGILKEMEGKVKEVRLSQEAYEVFRQQHLISALRYEKDTLVARIIDEENQVTGTIVEANISDAYLYMFGDDEHVFV